jgi:hypothetical protein
MAATAAKTLVVEEFPRASGIEATQPAQFIVVVHSDYACFHIGIVREHGTMTIGAAP